MSATTTKTTKTKKKKERESFDVPAHFVHPSRHCPLEALEARAHPEFSLYKEYLSEHQWRQMVETGYIPVVGSKGGRYVVSMTDSYEMGRVWRIFEPSIVDHRVMPGPRYYCVTVVRATPLDQPIAKVLLLQADEEKFLRVAK